MNTKKATQKVAFFNILTAPILLDPIDHLMTNDILYDHASANYGLTKIQSE